MKKRTVKHKSISAKKDNKGIYYWVVGVVVLVGMVMLSRSSTLNKQSADVFQVTTNSSGYTMEQAKADASECVEEGEDSECVGPIKGPKSAGNLNVGIDETTGKVISNPPNLCNGQVMLNITYNGTYCLPGSFCDNILPRTTVGWQSALNKPLKNIPSNYGFPLTMKANPKDAYSPWIWIHDNPGYRNSPLSPGLHVTRLGDGRVVISHAMSVTQGKRFQGIDATVKVAKATVARFTNGDLGVALDQPKFPDGTIRNHGVDLPFDGYTSKPPLFLSVVNSDGRTLNRYIGDELVGMVPGTRTWKQYTRAATPGDDYVVELSCTPPSPRPSPSSVPPSGAPSASPFPIPSPISCRNVDIALIFDRSGSMTKPANDPKILKAKEAGLAFMNVVQSMPSTSNIKVAVGSFGGQSVSGGVLNPIYNSTVNQALTPSLADARTAVENLAYTVPKTCVECGVDIANNQLSASGSRRIAIVLSDGVAWHNLDGSQTWTSTFNPRINAVNRANAGRSRGIEYYVVGYGDKSLEDDIDEATLIGVAGSTTNYQYTPNPTEWAGAFTKILSDVCSQ